MQLRQDASGPGGGAARKRQCPGRISHRQIATRDGAARQIDLDVVDQGCDFGATQLALSVGRPPRCHELLDRDLPISDQSVGLGRAGEAAAVADRTPLLQLLPGAPEIAAYRTLGLRRPGGRRRNARSWTRSASG